MNILCTICGRAGSKGIKSKNVRDFLGYPLPFFTFSAIDLYMRTNNEDRIDIAVNTDSEKLKELSKNNKFADVEIIDRESELAGDTVPKVTVIYSTMEKMSYLKNVEYDIVVDFDLTSPLRKVNDIDNLIKTHKSNGADVTFSVTESRRNPFFNMVRKTEHGYKKVLDSDFTARQQAPEIFDMNASLYAYKPEFLASGKNVLDGYCDIVKMEDTGVLDLDNENDFELMQVIARYLYENNRAFGEVFKNIKIRLNAQQL